MMALSRRHLASLAVTAAIALLAGIALGRKLARKDLPTSSSTRSGDTPVARLGSVPDDSPTPLVGAAVERWRHAATQPPSAARDRELQLALEALAARDPSGALALAAQETHRWRRAELRAAALRGWAAVDPPAAATWALSQPAGERESALAAVFAGAALANPAATVVLAQSLCAREPAFALDRGAAAIQALAAAGFFEQAVAFAASGAPEQRDAWTAAAFARWGEQRPEAAATHALNLAESARQRLAFQSLVTGWAQTEPLRLAEYATRMPAGENRTYALGEALRQWVDLDPVAASGWLDGFDPSPDLDGAVAAIALQPFLAGKRPDVALSWAESITESRLRSQTLAAIAREWASADRVAALRFVHGSADISNEDRADLLNSLASP